MSAAKPGWDVRYEWRVVTLLALGFGLVGLDRWIITPLFPTIMRDLDLSYQDVGNAIGALAIFWGLSAIFMGRLADRIGRRKVIVPAILIFSLTSVFTGFATGVISLVLVRGLMGVAEGAYAPACTAAAGEASEPRRRGRGQGIVFAMFPLFGLGLGPIIATQLLAVTPSWRWVFFLVAIPGFIVALLLWRVLREPERPERVARAAEPRSIPWGEVLRSRNVILATLGMISAMCCVFVLGAMMPGYLENHLGLTPVQMGLVMSALGFGGGLGNFLLPAISDYIGRRAAVLLAAVAAAAALLVLMRVGPDVPTLFSVVFVVALFSFGIVSTLPGPVATEAVPPALAGSAIGVVSGVAEVFGGGAAPILGGFVADNYGIDKIFYIGMAGLLLAVPIGALLTETAPRIVKARAGGAADSSRAKAKA